MKMNLQSRLLLPTLAAVVVGMSVAAWASFHVSREALREILQEQMAQTAEMTLRQTRSLVEELQKDLEGMSENPALAEALSSESMGAGLPQVGSILASAKERYPLYESLALTDASGRVVAASNPQMVGTSRSDRSYFREALAGKPTFSEVIRSKTTGQPIFVLAAPVKANGMNAGVVFAAIDLTKYTETYIAPIHIGEKGYSFVVDAEGRFISHPDPKLILDTNVKTYDWGPEFLAGKAGLLTYAFRGETKILHHKTEERTGWHIAIAATEEDIFAPIARIRTVNLLATVLTVLAVGVLIFLLVRSVVKAVRQGMEFAEAVRLGDVSRRLRLTRQDEVGQLGAALDAMADGLEEKARLAQTIAGGDLGVEVRVASEKDLLGQALTEMVSSLNELLGEVQVTGEEIATGAAQVSDASQSLSQGATESASSIEQIGSSMAEITSQTKTNAENAAQANRLSSQAREAAERGNGQMAEMVGAMAEINQAGQNISRIIKVIDEIAFQTNLLALNAAVEAARAGQHGKGFAVVAEEVRNLAARSAKAARETADLIEGSVVKAEKGAEIADRTALALGEIVQGVAKVSDLVAEIAAASNEQAQGLSQVTTGLGQIDQVTQQNTATAEESAAAAEELAGQADGLRRMLGRFRLRGRPAIEAGANVRHAPRKQPALPATHPWGEAARSSRPSRVIALEDGEFGRH